MRTIGVLGGMSAASTGLYYARLNALVQERLGGLHSASCLIRSVDFAPIEAMQVAGEWEAAGELLNREALRLEAGGAELLLLATNTMHKVAERITAGLAIPFIHIADATARAIRAAGFSRPGLMATAYTMEQDFYVGRLKAAGLDVLVPEEADRAATHAIIFDELCKGLVREASREAYEAVVGRLVERGVDCLILGCTEVGMLLSQANVAVPVFDTTRHHCDRAVELALEGEAPS